MIKNWSELENILAIESGNGKRLAMYKRALKNCKTNSEMDIIFDLASDDDYISFSDLVSLSVYVFSLNKGVN